MKLGQVIGLPWFFIGIINTLISSAIGLGCYQVGIFISTNYPTLWILPVIANIFAFINVLSAIVFLVIALVGLISFLITLFKK